MELAIVARPALRDGHVERQILGHLGREHVDERLCSVDGITVAGGTTHLHGRHPVAPVLRHRLEGGAHDRFVGRELLLEGAVGQENRLLALRFALTQKDLLLLGELGGVTLQTCLLLGGLGLHDPTGLGHLLGRPGLLDLSDRVGLRLGGTRLGLLGLRLLGDDVHPSASLRLDLLQHGALRRVLGHARRRRGVGAVVDPVDHEVRDADRKLGERRLITDEAVDAVVTIRGLALALEKHPDHPVLARDGIFPLLLTLVRLDHAERELVLRERRELAAPFRVGLARRHVRTGREESLPNRRKDELLHHAVHATELAMNQKQALAIAGHEHPERAGDARLGAVVETSRKRLVPILTRVLVSREVERLGLAVGGDGPEELGVHPRLDPAGQVAADGGLLDLQVSGHVAFEDPSTEREGGDHDDRDATESEVARIHLVLFPSVLVPVSWFGREPLARAFLASAVEVALGVLEICAGAVEGSSPGVELPRGVRRLGDENGFLSGCLGLRATCAKGLPGAVHARGLEITPHRLHGIADQRLAKDDPPENFHDGKNDGDRDEVVPHLQSLPFLLASSAGRKKRAPNARHRLSSPSPEFLPETSHTMTLSPAVGWRLSCHTSGSSKEKVTSPVKDSETARA